MGALSAPLIVWNTPPPTAPMLNAPPTSSTIRHGQGSLSAMLSLRIFYCGIRKMGRTGECDILVLLSTSSDSLLKRDYRILFIDESMY